jgi:RNA polymerase sigma-70 factor (ECF subfamily)
MTGAAAVVIISNLISFMAETIALTEDRKYEDLELFSRIAKGDEAAFTQLFHHYTPKLKPFILGIVKVEAIADEILQDTFLKVWTNKGNLVHVNEPAAWIYRVASNLSIEQLRRQATEYKNLKNIIAAEGKDPDDLLQKLSAKELQELIYEAVEQLPEKRKEIYLLTREEGLSHREIAEQLNISIQTVKNQVTTAVKSIQEHILKTRGIYIPIVLLTASCFYHIGS